MGSPDFALPTLEALIRSQHTISAIYTQPPRPAGRGKKQQPTAVHQRAVQEKLPVFTPERLKGDSLQTLLQQAKHVDAIIVVAYGLLLPKALVNHFPCLNLHPSALPRWRGAAPLQHTLLTGDASTEICIMHLDAGMDTGPVYSRTALDLPENINLGDLHDITASMGAEKMMAVLNHLEVLSPIPQTETGATIAPKITKEMRKIDWHQSAKNIHNHIRGLSPFPAATTSIHQKPCKLYASTYTEATHNHSPGEIISLAPFTVACGSGSLDILELQKAGSTRQIAVDFMRGSALAVGDIIGTTPD